MTETESLMEEALSEFDTPNSSKPARSRIMTPGIPLWDFPEKESRRTPVLMMKTVGSEYIMDWSDIIYDYFYN